MDDAATERAPYFVSVRELCAFTAKSGDLDHRFAPSPTAREGIAGHRTVAARRSKNYEAEVVLQGSCDGLHIRGRADGFDPASCRLEEIKTHRGPLIRVPENHRALHRAQAETYAHLERRRDELDSIDVAVVYFDIRSQTETPIERRYSSAELKTLFEDRCTRFARWADRQIEHRTARNAALSRMKFPHVDFRAGQRRLAEAVFVGARDGGCLLAQAPTGIGKTVGTIFPALKAMALHGLDKIFYLTAKTSGRQLAMDGLAALAGAGQLPLRVLELVARETACVHPGKECHGESCPLARGFYDRLADARDAAVTGTGLLDHARVRAVAAEHSICPYYLSHELVRWADVIVGDYNYYFDASAMLYALTADNEWRVSVLVDEAHNLVERARAMYSQELRHRDLVAATRVAPPPVKRALKRLQRGWQGIVADQSEGYRVHDDIAKALSESIDGVIAAIGEFQSDSTQPLDPALLSFFFEATNFARLTESFGVHSFFDVAVAPSQAAPRSRATPGTTESQLCIRSVVPAPHLATRFAAAHSTALFSATLVPSEFYRSMLGLSNDCPAIDVESPFSAEQLTVRIARNISTRFADRADSLDALAELIAAQFSRAPGNYIAFFSSFEYMQQAAQRLAQLQPSIAVWIQSPRMDDAAQTAFLERFEVHGRGIGFAVLGGRFAEGVDLPGGRLIGAFIATLGMPQVNAVNEQMRRSMTLQFGSGFEFTYLYPGLRKVVQAAGRVIRTTTDQGVIHLIDDRFAQPRVLKLLPSWWRIEAAH
jgi:DNA excision repair protein ERCC-2